MHDGKYMDDYSYHDWSKFMVRHPKDKPNGPHFGAVLFDTRTEWTPAYDKNHPDTCVTLSEIHYFAFPDKETLVEWIKRASKEKKQFFFFEVKKVGDLEVKVSVNLDV